MSMKQWQKIQKKEKVQNTSSWRNNIRIRLKVFKAPKVPKKEVLLERTHGIEVDNMLCDGIGITIWDMAGQTNYHSFHELVMPNLSVDGSCSIFLHMCNVDNGKFFMSTNMSNITLMLTIQCSYVNIDVIKT